MKITSATVFVLSTIVSPITLLAETPTIKVEATKTIGAGSLNPPNPTEACKEAKKNAIEKAASAGFKGTVVWDKLSVDSDCKLSTTRVGQIGYYYTFTAKGTFSLTGVQAQPDPQSDYKVKLKSGCLAARQTWIDNPDGSYQCTTSSGEINKCYKTTPPTPCTHIK